MRTDLRLSRNKNSPGYAALSPTALDTQQNAAAGNALNDIRRLIEGTDGPLVKIAAVVKRVQEWQRGGSSDAKTTNVVEMLSGRADIRPANAATVIDLCEGERGKQPTGRTGNQLRDRLGLRNAVGRGRR